MTWNEAALKIMWHQRRVMDLPRESRERQESIRVLRELESAARKFFSNEKVTAGTVTR